jgi:SET domain-containing protein
MKTTRGRRLVVRDAGAMGRGVFAGRPITKGELIEACPVIALSPEDELKLAGTVLDQYLFAWGRCPEGACLVLGLGSLYNHSSAPNATACSVDDKAVMEFIAVCDIATGEQIFVDYQWETDEYHFPSGHVDDGLSTAQLK